MSRIVLAAGLLAGGLVLVSSTPAGAATITSPGPLSSIGISNELNCSVNHIEDTHAEWYGSTACATLVSLNGTLFGPASIPAGSSAAPRTSFTTVSQSGVTGDGTAASPYTVVTVVGTSLGVTLTQTDTYVVGQEHYETSVTVDNSSAVRQVGNLYTAGDCYLQNSDYGYGRIIGTAPACAASTLPGSRLIQLLPRTGGNSFYQASYSQVWSWIGTQQPFPNTCRCTSHIDNGIGLSWDLNVAAGDSATWEWSTVFSPSGEVPLVVTATAHSPTSAPLDANGYRVEVANGNLDDATVDEVTVELPEGFVYTPGSTVGATTADPVISGQTLTWTGPFDVPSGGVITIDFGVTVASEAGTYTIDANAISPTHEVSPDLDTAPIAVQGQADLSLTKSASVTTAVAGETDFTYTLTASNAGPSTAPDVFVTDTLPAGFTFDPDTSDAACFALGQTVRCDVGTLATGEDGTVTVGVSVAGTATAGAKANLAVVHGGVDDPDGTNDSASATVTVERSVDVSVTKSASSTTVDAGGTVTFTMQVANAGPSTATVTFADVLPAGLTATSITGPSCSLSTLRCTLTLAADATSTVTLQARAAADLPADTVLTNRATVTAANDGDATNDAAEVDVTTTRSADVNVTKASGPEGLRAGSTGTYTLEVVNAGPSTATGVTVTDTLPDGVTFSEEASSEGCVAVDATVTCAVGTMQPLETVTLVIAVDVPPSVADGTELTNTATVATDDPDPDESNNTAEVTDTVGRAVDLVVSKAASAPSLNAGEPITYQVTVVNNGPSDASDVVVDDQVAPEITDVTAAVVAGTGDCTVDGSVACTLPVVAAGETVVVEITGTVDPASGPSTITNTATVSSAETDLVPDDNAASEVTDVVATTGLVVTKEASASPVVAGAPLTYTATVLNQGPSTSTGVTFTDPLPDGYMASAATASNGAACTVADGTVTCPDLGALAPTESVVVTISGAVAASLASGTLLDNAATALDDQGGTATGHNQTNVVRQANLTVTKTAAVDPVVAGGTAEWTITASNIGPSDAEGAVYVEVPDAGFTVTGLSGADCDVASLRCTVAALPAGGSVNITVSATVRPDVAAGTITNGVTLVSPDTDQTDNSGSSTVDVVEESDLTLTKVSVPDTVGAGDDVSYQLVVGNDGPSTATGVTVTDTLPAGLTFVASASSDGCTAAGQAVTCVVPSLAPGGSQALVVTATVDPGLGAGVVTNTASATADQPDPTPTTATADTTVTPSADLSITKTADPAFAGTDLTWTLTVQNAGPSPATGAVVTDTLPPGLSFVSATVTPDGSCSFAADTGTVTCTLGALAAGGSASVALVTAVAPDLVPPGQQETTVANTASVAFDGDPQPDNDTVTGQALVVAAARLVPTKTAEPEPLVAGTNATYRISVLNEGPSAATGVTVTDRLPDRLSFVAASSDPRCSLTDPATDTITCVDPGPVAVGGTSNFTIVALVDSTLGQGSVVVDDAVASSPLVDPDPDPAPAARAPSTVVRQVDLAVTKTVSADPVPAGASFHYTITVVNNGPSTADNVVIDDEASGTVTFLQGGFDPEVKSAPDCPGGGVTIRCRIPQLLPGESVTITIPVTASPDTPDGTVIHDTATVRSDDEDVDPSNNTSAASVTITRPPTPPTDTTFPAGTGDRPGGELATTGSRHLLMVALVGLALLLTGTVTGLAALAARRHPGRVPWPPPRR